jgi:hypothetical protein
MNRFSPHYSAIRRLMISLCAPGFETLECLDTIRKVFLFVALIEDAPDLWQDAINPVAFLENVKTSTW